MSRLPTSADFRPTPQRLHWDPVRFRAVSMQPVTIDHDLQPMPPLPDPHSWATQIARASVEGLLGQRPVHQLVRWLAPPVFEALSRRVRAATRQHVVRLHAVRVRQAIVSPVDDRIQEASCTVFDGERFRACAMRLREHRGRWLVVAIEIG